MESNGGKYASPTLHATRHLRTRERRGGWQHGRGHTLSASGGALSIGPLHPISRASERAPDPIDRALYGPELPPFRRFLTSQHDAYLSQTRPEARAAFLVLAEALLVWQWWRLPVLEDGSIDGQRLARVTEHFTVNLAVGGSLLLLALLGSGRFTVDQLLKKSD